MIINFTQTSAHDNSIDIYTDLVKEMCKYYHMDYNEQVFSYFRSVEGSVPFMDWVITHKKLGISYFNFSDEFDDYGIGFEITEDEHYTIYMLKHSK